MTNQCSVCGKPQREDCHQGRLQCGSVLDGDLCSSSPQFALWLAKRKEQQRLNSIRYHQNQAKDLREKADEEEDKVLRLQMIDERDEMDEAERWIDAGVHQSFADLDTDTGWVVEAFQAPKRARYHVKIKPVEGTE